MNLETVDGERRAAAGQINAMTSKTLSTESNTSRQQIVKIGLQSSVGRVVAKTRGPRRPLQWNTHGLIGSRHQISAPREQPIEIIISHAAVIVSALLQDEMDCRRVGIGL